MAKAPSVAEVERLAALRDHHILDSDPEPPFDDLVVLAAQCCRAPFASLSFVDDTREWTKACVGGGDRVLPRAESLAAHAIRQKTGKLFLIHDAREDPRVAGSPQVAGAPHLRFYVAVPLLSEEGHALGVLSVADDRPRLLDDAQAATLQALGRQAMSLLALRRRVQHLADTLSVRERAERDAEWQAGHDSLTGLPNRALFLRRVEDTLERARGTVPRAASAALLFVDLDRFKRINDTLGHAAGDILLREVAARFSGCLRPEDTLARLGGDEFTVLLPDISGTGYAAQVCQMLLRTLRRPVVLGSQELHVGASIGISTFPRDGEDAQTLLNHADIAMYQAKEKGGYRAYSRRMNADGYERLMEEGDLRRAIQQGDISVLYQPIIGTMTGEVQGVEALARWRHPERGPVPPAHFISLAEQADLIAPLGELVLRQACRDVAVWRRSGFPDLRVAVNLSARQLAQPRLGELVERVLEEHGLTGAALDVELTETALCGGGDAAPATLQHLRSFGIRLFVDDFGTGYSSLAYLRRFAVDVIKIDRAFVAGLGTDPRDEAIVRAVIDMAHALSLGVVAEGVETTAQRDCLRRLGCDRMQGYLFSRPITAEGVRGLLHPRGRRLRLPPSLLSQSDGRPGLLAPAKEGGAAAHRTGVS